MAKKKTKSKIVNVLMVLGKIAMVAIAIIGTIYAYKSYTVSRKSYILQKKQFETPFFNYAFSKESDEIEIKHPYNIDILSVNWVFPASSTIFAISGDGKVVSNGSSGPGKIYKKYDNSLLFNEFLRAYKEYLLDIPEVKNNLSGFFSLSWPDKARGYLLCQIFPTIQNYNYESSKPRGALVGAVIEYQRFDGAKGYTIDLLSIRQTQNKSPEIRVVRNVDEKYLRSSLGEMNGYLFEAIKRTPFVKNKEYINKDGECNSKQWGYIYLSPDKKELQ